MSTKKATLRILYLIYFCNNNIKNNDFSNIKKIITKCQIFGKYFTY